MPTCNLAASGRLSHFMKAEDIINWRIEKVGANHVLSLVVLKECAQQVTEDGFGTQEVDQYRVLRLAGGVYVIEFISSTTRRRHGT